MEYYIVYDAATGVELWRGSGPQGAIAIQARNLTDGQAIIEVPALAFALGATDYGAIRAFVVAKIDAAAEAYRLNFITPGSGQALTYQYKADEARAWTADNSTATPFLTAEAGARDMTIADLAAEVIAQADAWVAIGAAIEGARMGTKKAVEDAGENLAAIASALNVTWPTP